MKFSKQVLLFSFCFLTISAFGQQKLSWKKHVNLAKELFEKAQYADAGEHYRAAWRQKTKKTELIYKAGECFDIIRDYTNAAEAFKHVKKMNSEYPKVGLKYAQCLKQSGDFDNASHEFADFLANYQGSDKSGIAK
ncbi:MAG: thioredoxin-like negative regulator of GroEL, partial [Saprospiraceae bacterium]